MLFVTVTSATMTTSTPSTPWRKALMRMRIPSYKKRFRYRHLIQKLWHHLLTAKAIRPIIVVHCSFFRWHRFIKPNWAPNATLNTSYCSTASFSSLLWLGQCILRYFPYTFIIPKRRSFKCYMHAHNHRGVLYTAWWERANSLSNVICYSA